MDEGNETVQLSDENDLKENETKSKQFDSTVQEILDICQSYNDQCNKIKALDTMNSSSPSPKSCNNRSINAKKEDKNIMHITNKLNDQLIREALTPTPPHLFSNSNSCNKLKKVHNNFRTTNNNSVSHMQAEQSALQEELNSIIKNQDCLNDVENDKELIEFQKLENEVRIAELNRKLETIQEAIRIKLYNQLFSQNYSDSSSNEALSSSSEGGFELITKHSSASESEVSINQSNISTGIESPYKSESSYIKQRTVASPKYNYDYLEPVNEEEVQSISVQNRSESVSLFDGKKPNSSTISSSDFLPPTIKEFFYSSCKQQLQKSDSVTTQSSQSVESINSQYYLEKVINHSRIISALRDLDRIDEGEEELSETNQNTYLSHNTFTEKNSGNPHDKMDSLDLGYTSSNKPICNIADAKSYSVTDINRKQNRPLTLYLPKPDEDIDLIDHVQVMGHDINMICEDIKISPTRASGLLWKSCMRSPKKWRKRYFLFDRSSKVLSYFRNERDLVKNECTPNNIIKFDNIIDVYVDHKLSGAKDRSRNRNYVFVLSTKQRNYILASAKAETMRVWIDIMFTAAQSYNYF